MLGQMMDAPLLISELLRHAERYHGDTEIVSRSVEGPIHRYTYADAARRARQLARALERLGVARGDSVATLAWNGYRHYELYYAIAGLGGICHTVNPRLFAEQIRYIVNHGEAGVLCFDASFLPQIEQLAPLLPAVHRYVLLTDRAHMPAHSSLPELLCYEELLAAESDDYDWPRLDEQTASGLCYTSGTTGHPKGVLYSHRSTVLHALSSSLPDAFGVSADSAILPVVPMFHVNAWGFPYSATLNGAKLVLPGAKLDAASLYELIAGESVTVAAGVPTVWLALLQHCAQQDLTLDTLERVIVGGSAVPEAMIDAFAAHGAEVRQLWGMTELSPVGTTSSAKFKHRQAEPATLRRLQLSQGRPIFGVALRLVDAAGHELPQDGVSFGRLQVQSGWALARYFRRDESCLSEDGWFDTGDVATIDADGYMKITDRTKDVIKSGGEWISSIELENILIGHPAVAEAAAIGVAHPKWDERPLMVVVLKPGARATREELLAFYQGKVAKWWVPDDVAIVAELPHTATGKLQKMALRAQFENYRWPDLL